MVVDSLADFYSECAMNWTIYNRLIGIVYTLDLRLMQKCVER